QVRGVDDEEAPDQLFGFGKRSVQHRPAAIGRDDSYLGVEWAALLELSAGGQVITPRVPVPESLSPFLSRHGGIGLGRRLPQHEHEGGNIGCHASPVVFWYGGWVGHTSGGALPKVFVRLLVTKV